MKASVLRRIEKLEEQLKPLEPELPPFDYDLLIESESDYFSKQMDLLRTKARELGYKTKTTSLAGSTWEVLIQLVMMRSEWNV